DRCRQLLESGSEVDVRDVFQRTPLINAAVGSHEALVRVLVDFRADLSCADRSSGWTALHWAAFQGDAKVAQTCISLGADPLQKDRKGSTPREVAENVLDGKKEAKFGEGLQGQRGFAEVLALLPASDCSQPT
ncbi:unnamed protein product, partial [Polarella glacialis]